MIWIIKKKDSNSNSNTVNNEKLKRIEMKIIPINSVNTCKVALASFDVKLCVGIIAIAKNANDGNSINETAMKFYSLDDELANEENECNLFCNDTAFAGHFQRMQTFWIECNQTFHKTQKQENLAKQMNLVHFGWKPCIKMIESVDLGFKPLELFHRSIINNSKDSANIRINPKYEYYDANGKLLPPPPQEESDNSFFLRLQVNNDNLLQLSFVKDDSILGSHVSSRVWKEGKATLSLNNFDCFVALSCSSCTCTDCDGFMFKLVHT